MPRHSDTRKLPYSAKQMYELVADVASYPEFLPWCGAARVRSVEPQGEVDIMLADLIISFKVFRESFGSRVVLYKDGSRIDTSYIEGPVKHLNSVWRFEDLEEGGCEVSFEVDFEFKSRLLQGAAGMFFGEAMSRIIRAFETRAEALYETP